MRRGYRGETLIMDGQRLLAIDLNDHLLGASGRVDLFERAAGAARGHSSGAGPGALGGAGR